MISKRADSIQDSITMAITAQAKKMKQEGLNVLGFSAGEPDFDTPDRIKNAAIKAIQEGKTKYTPTSGIPELKSAICDKFLKDDHLTYKPENIVVSCGAKHSIFNVILALINPGDEVIIPSPYWVSYPDQVNLAEGKPVIIETTDAAHFKITPAQLQQAITPRTKLLIINSPSNPTGSVYTKKELEAIADVVIKNNIVVLSDEIYEKLIYEGEKHTSIASLSDEMKKRTIVVNGVSKAYSMTGWRIGYIAATKEIAAAADRIQSQSTSNATSISQWASVEALKSGDEPIGPMKIEFNKRRNYMVQTLNQIKGVSCLSPQGAFYTFPKVSALYGKKVKNSDEFCKLMLEEALVACVPGSGFGADEHIRLSYATSMNDIEEGLKRIKTWVETLD